MFRNKKRPFLFPALLFTWLLVLLLGVGLAGMILLDTPPAAQVSPADPLPEKAETDPVPLPARTSSPTPAPSPTVPFVSGGDAQLLRTDTPEPEGFPATPILILSPEPFFEGPMGFGTTPGGRPLEVYRFGTGPVQRMIVAGIHGGYEWNTVHLAEELIAELKENPSRVPRNVTLLIVPSLNPDGYARSRGFDGRVNDNGVDLNRNFPVNWLPDWDRAPCWNFAPTSSGESAGSEPETRALIAYIEEKTRVTALISYHSAALGIFPGGDPADEESVRLAGALAAVSTYPYPPLDTGCEYSGTLADWAASRGIAAVDLELHTHYFTDFDENLSVLDAFLAWRR